MNSEMGDSLTWSEIENLYLQASLWRGGRLVRTYVGLVEIEFRGISFVSPRLGLPGIASPSSGYALRATKSGVKLIVEEVPVKEMGVVESIVREWVAKRIR